ncbi:MAG: recombination regulator RecX [Oceanospirillaceae bacterium]|jgi:regulatory protein|nr:recombination regulator RecX [Oceanospirillaceae bacterium]
MMDVEYDQDNTDKQLASLRYQAMGLLARREQSRSELQQKLQIKCLAKNWVVDLDHLLDELERQGLQSDERFAEVLVRSKARDGYGVTRIFQWGHQYGLSRLLVQWQVDAQQPDWFEIALAQKRKHCGWRVATDAPARAKQARYLYQRGFAQEQIQYALQMQPE